MFKNCLLERLNFNKTLSLHFIFFVTYDWSQQA
jgi:hypothetical protein